MKLNRRVALITGAGRATALAMTEEGAGVAVNGLSNQSDIDEVVRIIQHGGGQAISILADVSDPDQVNSMVEQVARELGPVDVLVSNAAIRPHGPLTEFTDEQWRRVMAVDLDATFYLARAVIPEMAAKGKGSIIAISGLAAFGVRDHAVAVATAKAGLAGMMRGIARDYAGDGIRANIIVPGNMATDRYDQEAYLDSLPAARIGGPSAQGGEGVPLGREGYPEELAAACIYLASDDAGYTTGQTLHVGGGLYME